MKDYSLKKPCVKCPFRRGPDAVRGLREERLLEIIESEGGFACHMTLDYDDEDEEGEVACAGGSECAGFLIYNLVNESCPQMMRIAGRIGMIDEDELLSHEDEVITDWDELVEAHENSN